MNPRQRPTLPPTCAGSTIGGSRLNFRVRNGNGCDPAPMATGKLFHVCSTFVLRTFCERPSDDCGTTVILGVWGPSRTPLIRRSRKVVPEHSACPPYLAERATVD